MDSVACIVLVKDAVFVGGSSRPAAPGDRVVLSRPRFIELARLKRVVAADEAGEDALRSAAYEDERRDVERLRASRRSSEIVAPPTTPAVLEAHGIPHDIARIACAALETARDAHDLEREAVLARALDDLLSQHPDFRRQRQHDARGSVSQGQWLARGLYDLARHRGNPELDAVALARQIGNFVGNAPPPDTARSAAW